MKIIRKLFFIYQDVFFYIQQARSEIGKWLGLYTETALAILLLKGFGVQITWKQAVIFYIALLVILFVMGYILDRIGVVRYNIQLSNERNEILVDIKRMVKEMWRKHER